MTDRRGLVALACLVIVAGCQKKEEAAPQAGTATAPQAESPAATEIRIGQVGSLTGQEATFGTSTDKGVRLAVKQLMADGGLSVGGQGPKLPIRVITYDDQGKVSEAAAATTKLIVDDKVHLVVGEVASSRSKAMAPIAQQNQVPMISPSSTNPDVTKGKDYVFRMCFIDPFQGAVMASFVRNELKLDKVAILRDVGNDYSVGLADVFAARFADAGGTIVGDASYEAGDINFKAQLTELRAKQPQAIYVPGYYTDVGLVARQARELGINVPLLGGDGWESQKLFEIGGPAVEGAYYSNHYAVEDPSPRLQQFVATYKAEYGGEIPDSMAALGYDTIMVAADAIKRAKSIRGPDLREALAATKDFPVVTGTITYDQDRNAVKPAVVLKVQGGKAVYVSTVKPEGAPAPEAAKAQ